MPGSFPVASKILHKYEQDRAYRLHRQKVTTVKPRVATKGPKKYPHLILSLKKIQLEEEKQAEVDHENRLLLHKMTNIMKNRAQVDNWNEYEPRSLNYVARERHIREIQSENIGIAKRLEKAQPVINVDDLEKDYKHRQYLQSLWSDSAKDYEEVTPRHQRFKELKRSKDGIEESDEYDDDFEDDSPKEKKREKLPPLTEDKTSKSIKYSYNPYTNKSSSDNGSLPRIDGKKFSSKSSEKSVAESRDDDEVSPTNPTDNDCKQLFKVAKEMAPPADIIIKTLVKKTPKQRMQTSDRFKEMYDLDLASELKSGLGPEWTPLIDALLNDSNSSGAKKLHDALEVGDYSQAVEIMCSCNKSSMSDMKESYKKEYAVSLESDIKDKTEDPEQALLLILLKIIKINVNKTKDITICIAERLIKYQTAKGIKDDSGKVDEKTAEKDAEQLHETGEGRWSGKFLKLLNSKSIAHIRVVLNLYTVETHGIEAEDDIKKECSKNYAEALVTLIHHMKGAETYQADQLFKNMTPTNPVFIDILVNKNDSEMAAIRKEYKKKYDAELTDDVKHKCKSHPTEKVLVELAGKSKGGKGGQKKGGAAPPPSKKPANKRPQDSKNQKGNEGDNPLSKPAQRVTADAAQQKKDDKKNAEKEKKQKEEEKKNKSGTVQAASPFDPDDDVLALHEAMDGLGTDEQAIIDIIPKRSNSQRQTLKKKYQEKYKKDLTKELKSELTGDTEEIILALMMPPVEYDAYCLHEAMDGLGTTESTLIGILCTRNAKEKQAIKEQYKKDYKTDLEKDIVGDTSGGFKEILVELLKGERDQGTSVNQKQAQEEAKKLWDTNSDIEEGEDVNEDVNEEDEVESKQPKVVNLNCKEFKEIMTKRNKAQLRATFDEYKKLSGHDIAQGIANAMSGDTEDAYIGLVTAVQDTAGFYADRLHSAFKGLGTNDNMLIRIVVSRSEIDLGEIKAKYKEKYGKTLKSQIESECSGDYKKILLVVIGD